MSSFLIFGSNGVVGSEFCSYLADKELVIQAENLTSDFGEVPQFHKVSPETYTRVFNSYPSPIIYHFAQMSRVPLSIQYPYSSFKNNVDSVLNILEGIRKSREDIRFIFLSSREVYGNIEKQITISPFFRRQALHPYGASKLASEAIIEAYTQTYGLRTMIVRLSSVYGSMKDHPTRLIPRLILNALVNKKIKAYIDGDKTFDFVYIDDVVKALYQLPNSFNDAWAVWTRQYNHITSGIPTSIEQLCKMIAERTKASIERLDKSERNWADQKWFVGDTETLKWAIPSWNPLAIKDGLNKTIAKYEKLTDEELVKLYKLTAENDYSELIQKADLK